jgi:flagellar biosynthesis/type III secretory pathway M-ring protein FliF/YscJ
MDKSKVALVSLAFCLFAIPVHAYVGPGAGLSLLGALWALIAAIAAALIFVIAWPIRRMRRRKREARAAHEREQAVEDEGRPDNATTTRPKRSGDEDDVDSLQPQ